MAVLDDIKIKLGIYYSDPIKDREVQMNIEAAQIFFKGAGWNVDIPDAMGLEAIHLYCKMAQNTDPVALQNHPVLISFVAQRRN